MGMSTAKESLKHSINLCAPKFYNNRELSWLAFNERVLQEALNTKNPLLERLKFLAIFSSNLDEFFMVRVAGLLDQVDAGFNKPENKAGLTPKQQLEAISNKNRPLVDLEYKTLHDVIIPKLKKEGIQFLNIDQLSSKQLDELEQYFDEQIFPVLTPMAIDTHRPFPMLLNKTLNLAVVLKEMQEQALDEPYKVAIVQVPSLLKRFISLTNDNEHTFILLEKVISHFIYKLFKGYEVVSTTEFRITRNADLTIHEEGARDLLKEIEKELKQRRWGNPVRLEIRNNHFDDWVMPYLIDQIDIHPKDVYFIDGPLDLTFLFSFYKELAPIKEHLVYQTLIPQPPRSLDHAEDLFVAASEKDIFLHHPYESFQTVIDFVTKAANDPDTLAIKQTLYRVSGDSPVIEALKTAAENGKQVTVLVELKARFDEENNVQWAKELDKAGCHVIYGMHLLKVHSKITLVVRRKHNKIERLVHLGTGNYNESTAKLYTDMGIITSNRKFGIDATNFFNYLSGFTEKPDFHHISVAPFNLKDEFITLVDQEIESHKQYGDGRIIAKMNSLTDKKVIIKLYEASQAGVKIDLIVRGICCLKPKIKGVSENIRVRSIVGRFLEHSRIYYFNHHGESKFFLSSADLMTRNMERRIEIMFPIYEGYIKQELTKVLSVLLTDNVNSREQDEFGDYHFIDKHNGEPEINSQLVLFNDAYRLSDDEE